MADPFNCYFWHRPVGRWWQRPVAVHDRATRAVPGWAVRRGPRHQASMDRVARRTDMTLARLGVRTEWAKVTLPLGVLMTGLSPAHLVALVATDFAFLPVVTEADLRQYRSPEVASVVRSLLGDGDVRLLAGGKEQAWKWAARNRYGHLVEGYLRRSETPFGTGPLAPFQPRGSAIWGMAEVAGELSPRPSVMNYLRDGHPAPVIAEAMLRAFPSECRPGVPASWQRYVRADALMVVDEALALAATMPVEALAGLALYVFGDSPTDPLMDIERAVAYRGAGFSAEQARGLDLSGRGVEMESLLTLSGLRSA